MSTEILLNPFVLVLLGGMGSLVLLWAKSQIEAFSSRVEKQDARLERRTDKQEMQGESLAGVTVRVDALEESHAKIGDALQRIARIEERQSIWGAKIQEVDGVGRSVAAIERDVKTLFNRVDDMDERLPERVAIALYAKLRPAETMRPSNVREAHG